MKAVYEDDFMKVSVVEQAGQKAVLCFSGVGTRVVDGVEGMGGVDVQTEEFYRATDFATGIFIVDKTRSWGNRLDFDHLQEIIAPYIAGREVHTLGMSMGGFLAILAAKFMNIRSAIAFVPQYSVKPDIVPFERRWLHYAGKVQDWKYPSLEGVFNDTTAYYVLGTPNGGDDGKHLNMLPDMGNLHKVYFPQPEAHHKIGRLLKEEGILYDVIVDCMKGVSTQELIENQNLAAFHGGCDGGLMGA